MYSESLQTLNFCGKCTSLNATDTDDTSLMNVAVCQSDDEFISPIAQNYHLSFIKNTSAKVWLRFQSSTEYYTAKTSDWIGKLQVMLEMQFRKLFFSVSGKNYSQFTSVKQ